MSGDFSQVPPFLWIMGKLGKLSGISKSPATMRTVTRNFLPMDKGVVAIGLLVGLKLRRSWLTINCLSCGVYLTGAPN